jgi:putative FmdB family regulatory protein
MEQEEFVCMPIYEYLCNDCGHRMERFQSLRDAPLTVCPVCEGHLRKLMSPAGIIFKGSGWYKTDSRGANGTGNGATPDTKASETKGDAAAATAAKSGEASTASKGAEPASTTAQSSPAPAKPSTAKATPAAAT